MATQLYRVRMGATATTSGRELIDCLETIGDAFARLKRIQLAMIQQKDGSANDETDYVTMATMFGFVNAADQLTPSVAMAAFLEIDSFVAAAGPSLEQCTSRMKQ